MILNIRNIILNISFEKELKFSVVVHARLIPSGPPLLLEGGRLWDIGEWSYLYPIATSRLTRGKRLRNIDRNSIIQLRIYILLFVVMNPITEATYQCNAITFK